MSPSFVTMKRRSCQRLSLASSPSDWIFRCSLLLFLLLQQFLVHGGDDTSWKPRIDTLSQSQLFEPSDIIPVIAPSQFPVPTRALGDNVTIIVQPTFGTHRAGEDAILAYAEGYGLTYYMMFMETLKDTGYRGDVVMAIAEQRILRPDVKEYLQTFAQGDRNKPNLVVYQQDLFCDGVYNNNRQVSKSGDTDIFQFCQLPHVYGVLDEKTGRVIPADDPREGRVVATIRYEWYWIWSHQYNPHVWIMLIDMRDSFFQSNPFDDLPRDMENSPNGLLYFFGENANATRLGKSKKNMKWLRTGYGPSVLEALADKPTICSGSTMGEQIAIETYLRALINEHDESNTRMTGSDQGFHNYLYYSSKLAQAAPIREIIVWEQGRGIINNLGAMRTKPLREWGILDPQSKEIYQWDGTLSPVVHQWDRDKELHANMYTFRHGAWSRQWERQKQQMK